VSRRGERCEAACGGRGLFVVQFRSDPVRQTHAGAVLVRPPEADNSIHIKFLADFRIKQPCRDSGRFHARYNEIARHASRAAPVEPGATEAEERAP